MIPLVAPLTCDGGCGEVISGKALVITFADRPGCYCDECASEIALDILDGTPGVTQHDIHTANVVIAVVNARRKARVERQRAQRDSASGPQLPALSVLNAKMCAACAAGTCQQAGFPVAVAAPHSCGRK